MQNIPSNACAPEGNLQNLQAANNGHLFDGQLQNRSFVEEGDSSQQQIQEDALQQESTTLDVEATVTSLQVTSEENLVTGPVTGAAAGEYINEYGELALAYETQKTINKQLELELQDEKKKYKAYEKEFKLEIEKLRDDNERQQREIEKLTRKLKDNGLDFDESLKEKNYLGMFAFNNGDENSIMKQLVIELKPRTAVTLLPDLPAYIMFMCIRHTDYINDKDKVGILFSTFINSVKKVIKERHEDFESMVLWLSNTLRLMDTMKQYSGDKAFQGKNLPKQNSQSLRNFDLSEYRQLLSDIAVWIFQGIVRFTSEKVEPLIVPAILEHEEIAGSGNTMRCFRCRSSGARDLNSPCATTDTLLQELTSHYKMLTFYGLDPDVTSQIFKQVFYFLCASSLNNLLMRKGLCNWSKGLQIRHNLSHLEMWTRGKQLDEAGIQSTLQPIIQAAHLLQARQNKEDVDSVCEMCSALTQLQICHILNLYTPIKEYEQRVPESFIREVQAKLQERSTSQEQQTLLMDIKFHFPVRFSFNPSVICLEDIEVPEVLKLPMLEKVLVTGKLVLQIPPTIRALEKW